MKAKRRKSAGAKGLSARRMRARPSAGVGTRREQDWMSGAEDLFRPIKKPVTLRLDADVLAWFRRQGQGYQTRINLALRGVMMKERKVGG
jgi:uncharacterized protein (DUF4415 family)